MKVATNWEKKSDGKYNLKSKEVEQLCYMLYDRKNKKYLRSGTREIWLKKSGAVLTAHSYNRTYQYNELEIHEFKMLLNTKLDLTPKFISEAI